MGEQEFEEVYTKHRAHVFQLCSRILKNTAEAEDATQESFMRLLTHHDQFQHRSSLSTYLYRIATNTALMRLRQPWTRKAEPLDVIHDRRVSPNLVKDLSVHEGLAKIPAQDRDILRLCCEEGFSLREMAGIHNASVPAIKARLFRARKKLEAVL